jgi:D-serine deaminase-like pyridoxal phosphate-dependent protein
VPPLIDWRPKGWPDRPYRGLRVEDLEPPVLCLRDSALEHNLTAMAQWCTGRGVDLAPHGKTTMAPAIFARQLEAGARAITVATPAQARVCRRAGVPHIVIANQVIEPSGVAWMRSELDRHPEVRLACFADSVEAVAALARPGGERPVDVLLEVGYPGGRGGVRDRGELRRVAQAAAASAHVRLVGVAGYEGLIARDRDADAVRAVDAFVHRIGAAARDCAPLFEVEQPVLSAGGSAYFDRVADVLEAPAEAVGGRVLLRPGCYVTHDHGLYARAAAAGRMPVFQPALTLLTYVLSRPEARRAIVAGGKRDVASDVEAPIALGADGRPDPNSRVVRLDDQHLHLEVAAGSPLRPGDAVTFGMSHPCAAFDRWRLIPLVDDEGRVVEAIDTYF